MDLLYTGGMEYGRILQNSTGRDISRTPPEPESPWNGLVRASGTLGVL